MAGSATTAAAASRTFFIQYLLVAEFREVLRGLNDCVAAKFYAQNLAVATKWNRRRRIVAQVWSCGNTPPKAL